MLTHCHFQETDVRKAAVIKIVPFRYQGKGAIIELEHSKVLVVIIFISRHQSNVDSFFLFPLVNR